MVNEEKLKQILEILQTYLLIEKGKFPSESDFIKHNEWVLGATWMLKFVLEKYPKLEFEKNQSEMILKSRPLFDPEQIEKIMEIIDNSHLEKVKSNLITQKGNVTDGKGHTCKNCTYAKNKRPDGIKMLPVNVWCTRIRKEMPGHLSCSAGRWGFF
jgi:hypothetical protein